NTAKINILRLHDAKHGGIYRNWNSTKTFAAMPCNAAANPRDPNCLANQTPIQCSRCHYSPALDLAQAGPVDEPEQGLRGRQQTRHVSMSRAMHGFHGALPPFQGKPLFPAMPAPTAQGRDHNLEHQILDQTCYQCHPGKRTQCLRGAMFTAGVVCQDCHGDMQQVGNDFSTKVSTATPGAFVLDGSLRVPWANEPACQSCHTGDAVTTHRPVGAIVAKDGIRLLQAYVTKTLSVPGLPAPLKIASLIKSPSSRFAENQNVNGANKTVDVLYRLSQGHGGVACEGCHNSTHAIWPNPNPFANDNVAANQLQGHTGTLIECDTCHAPGTLGRTLNGPHGMHPLDANWVRGHEDVAEHNLGACQSCHGQQLQGTVLSKVAQTRTFTNIEDVGTVTLLKGSLVSCALCHENPLFGD
ncbi:MAG: cytochrome C, partial [Gammaproteobacteria bacterium]